MTSTIAESKMSPDARDHQAPKQHEPDGRGNLRSGRLFISLGGFLLILLLGAGAIWRIATVGGDAVQAGSVAAQIQTFEMRLASERRVGQPNTLTLTGLGLLYVSRAAEVEDPGFYAKSRLLLNEAAALEPDRFEVQHANAALELAAHQFGPALIWARKSHDTRPASSAGYAVLVDSEIENGLYDEAEIHLNEWLALKPDLPSLSRASYFRELNGDGVGAILAMNAAASAGQTGSADLGTVEAYLGDVYLLHGDLQLAEAAYRKSLMTSPNNLLGEVGLAKVLAATGRSDEAVARLTGIAETVPAPNVTGLLAELHFAAGREQEFRQAFDRMRNRYEYFEASGADATMENAIMEATYGDPEAALVYANAAYAGRQSIFTADAMGWALTRADRAGEALAFVEESLKLNTRNPAFMIHAAFAYAQVGQLDIARDLLKSAIAINPHAIHGLNSEVSILAHSLGLQFP